MSCSDKGTAMTKLYRYLCEVVDAYWERVIGDYPGPKRSRCPECGGTDYFNGYGVCQECEEL